MSRYGVQCTHALCVELFYLSAMVSSLIDGPPLIQTDVGTYESSTHRETAPAESTHPPSQTTLSYHVELIKLSIVFCEHIVIIIMTMIYCCEMNEYMY